MRRKFRQNRTDGDDTMVLALLAVAKERQLTHKDAITALARILVHNELYRRKPSRQGKQTRYDVLLEETQPALALAWELLRKMADPDQEEGQQ